MLPKKVLVVALPALLAFSGFSPAAVAAPKKKPPALRCFKNQTAVKTKSGKVVCKRKSTKTSSTGRPTGGKK